MKALFLSDKSFQHRLFGAQSCPALKGGPLYRAIGSLENLCFQLESRLRMTLGMLRGFLPLRNRSAL